MAKSSKTTKAVSPLMKLTFKLDPEKIQQIQRCLQKGRLTITVSKAEGGTRAASAYLYD